MNLLVFLSLRAPAPYNVFGTRFDEMDHEQGRSQTTKGIWLAKAQKPAFPTLVLDLEGSDGRERGEDDTAFEKQTALFAMVRRCRLTSA